MLAFHEVLWFVNWHDSVEPTKYTCDAHLHKVAMTEQTPGEYHLNFPFNVLPGPDMHKWKLLLMLTSAAKPTLAAGRILLNMHTPSKLMVAAFSVALFEPYNIRLQAQRSIDSAHAKHSCFVSKRLQLLKLQSHAV